VGPGRHWIADANVAARRWWARVRQVVTTEPAAAERDVVQVEGARALADQAARLGAGMLKVAQVSAYLDLLDLDEKGRAPLAALWDRAPAAPADALAAVVRQELGAEPQDLFARWDPTPLAAASIGQVHGAADIDGREFAVKIQYPWVAEALRADVQSGNLLRRLMSAPVGHRLDDQALAALRQAVLAELDYRSEAQAMQRFARAFASTCDLVIPEVDLSRSAGRVLTMTRIRGATIAEAARAPAEIRRAVARTLLWFSWAGPLRYGLVHADPNPGNYLVIDGPPVQLAVLDYGCTGEVDDTTQANERTLWQSLLHHDPFEAAERFRFALHSQHIVVDGSVFYQASYRRWERLVTAPFVGDDGFTWDAAYARALIDNTRTLVRGGQLNLPAPVLLLWRQRLGVAAVLGMLAAPVDARAVLRQVLAAGP
jgi:predicted unusual protein kinase regulating ubiquinone biosynthesis (AarF/ABC1/UbiB family)